MTFTCPRRIEDGTDKDNSPLKYGGSNKDTWGHDNTCDYCGSFNPDDFMRHLEARSISLTPTDKNYKVYIEGIPNPDAGKPTIYASANHPQSGEGWVQVTPENRGSLPECANRFEDGYWVKVEPTVEIAHHKLYFQHLTSEQKKRFVTLLNEQKLSLSYPGYFYVNPFFCSPIS